VRKPTKIGVEAVQGLGFKVQDCVQPGRFAWAATANRNLFSDKHLQLRMAVSAEQIPA
jgi:hypothetical protein